MIACVNAVGNAIPPCFGFKGKLFNPKLMKGATPWAKVLWMVKQPDLQRVSRRTLVTHLRRGSDEKQPIFLFIDGHSSHVWI